MYMEKRLFIILDIRRSPSWRMEVVHCFGIMVPC
nr:MAG TPA: hypothetical protein [Caudoviricetes sp.]